MFNNFEKSIGFIGNLVTIITFVLSICNWLGFGFIADASIPTERAAKCVLCLYCGFASYGQARALDEHAKKNDNSVLLWFMLSFSYAFGFLFLLEKAQFVMHLSRAEENGPISLAWVANISLMLAVYFYKRIYPKGGVIAYLKNFFGVLKETYFWFLHMLTLGLIFFILH